jgi:hypothetical protein
VAAAVGGVAKGGEWVLEPFEYFIPQDPDPSEPGYEAVGL